MVRLLRVAILLGCTSLAASAFATTYYIAANGSDSNNGTSTSTPWLHAPAMTGCGANCLSKTPAPGDRFILRGGDTWHFGGRGTPVGLPWVIYPASPNDPFPDGTASSHIYIGVDRTTPGASGTGTVGWYGSAACGSSWCRPRLTGDNPLSTKTVSSCAYSSTGTFVDIASIQYLDLDDIEFSGVCDNGTYISHGFGGSRGDHRVLSNLYFHGWSHTAGNGGNLYAMWGSSYGNANPNDDLNGLVCDGSDSEYSTFTCFMQGITNIRNSVIRYNANGIITNSAKSFHDNLFENIVESTINGVHSNGFEQNTSFQSNNYIYNNLIRNIPAAVAVWSCTSSGQTDFYFNNVMYNSPAGWSVSNGGASSNGNACAGSGGVTTFLNNTFVDMGAGSNGSWSTNRAGNFLINSNWAGTVSGANTATVAASDATANSYGYSATNGYAPTTPDCNNNQSATACPVGKGVNLASTCAALNAASPGVGDALCRDTTLGPAYDIGTHRVHGPARVPALRPTIGAWDAGAFQLSSSAAPTVNPPTGLTAIPK